MIQIFWHLSLEMAHGMENISLTYQYAAMLADHLTNASFCFEVIICDSSNESVVQIGAIDALASYGKQALNALTEVINTPSIANQVKAQGFKTIEDIKKNSLS